MTKNEKICLIIEAIVSAGYSDVDAFVNYITNDLVNMSTEALANELEAFESKAMCNTMVLY